MGVVVEKGPQASQGTAGGRLQLQNVGAIVGQQPGTKRAGHVFGQVQHLDAVQRAGQTATSTRDPAQESAWLGWESQAVTPL